VAQRPASSPHLTPIPPEVAAVATNSRLGVYRGTYEPKRLGVVRIVGLLLFGLPFLVAAVVVPFVGAWQVAPFLAAVGAVFLWILFRAPNLNPGMAARKLYVFEQGFVQIVRSAPVEFRWDAITSVLQSITRRYYNGVYVGTTYLYTVTRADGRVTKLTQFYDQIGTFGQTLAQEVTAIQLPRAIEALQAGQTVYFGELAVNLGGIAAAGKGSVPWSEIQAVQINKGYVSLRKHGKWLAWSGKPASTIPNLFVFLTLAERLAGNAQAAGAR